MRRAVGSPVTGKLSSMRTVRIGKLTAKNSYSSTHMPGGIGSGGSGSMSRAQFRNTCRFAAGTTRVPADPLAGEASMDPEMDVLPRTAERTIVPVLSTPTQRRSNASCDLGKIVWKKTGPGRRFERAADR